MKLYNLDGKLIKKTYDCPHKFTGITESSYGTKIWYFNGNRHRIGGHAVEWGNGTKEWWIDNKSVTEQQHALLVDIMKLKGLT